MVSWKSMGLLGLHWYWLTAVNLRRFVCQFFSTFISCRVLRTRSIYEVLILWLNTWVEQPFNRRLIECSTSASPDRQTSLIARTLPRQSHMKREAFTIMAPLQFAIYKAIINYNTTIRIDSHGVVLYRVVIIGVMVGCEQNVHCLWLTCCADDGNWIR